MKQIRILLASALAIISAASSYAQNMYDAINFSRNEYYGSARSMGLGGAVSAVGGDLGTIGINPAGAAVATYGQFTITPAISMSSVSSAFSADGFDFSSPVGNKQNRFTLPNLGMSFYFDNRNANSALKSMTLAIVSNQTSQYNNYSQASGSNPYSSKMGEFGYSATGIDEGQLRDYFSYENTNIPWDLLTAYQAGMIGAFGDRGYYAGLSEAISEDGSYTYLPAPLNQTSVTSKTGSKSDILFNISANFSDKLFIGFNLGIPTINYSYDEQFYEAASNPELFPITYNDVAIGSSSTNFKSAYYGYRYYASAAGINAKFGLIYTPIKGLRLAAAIQSPTLMTISESWQSSARTRFTDSSFDGSASSPGGDYDYSLRTPYSANFGFAYTFGRLGLLSVDYEITDYSIMKFSELERTSAFGSQFSDLNDANRLFTGVSSSLRIGAELRLSPMLSVRAGYGISNCPEFHWTNENGEDVNADAFLANYDDYFAMVHTLRDKKRYEDTTSYYSFGLGYSSNGSFFADLGFMRSKYSDSVYSPYYQYDCFNSQGQRLNVSSAKVLNARSLTQIALTLGWRF